MPLSTTTTFTCDRDGVTAQVTGPTASVNPPPDWGRMLYDFKTGQADQSVQSLTGFLCPTCSAAFQSFMDQPGGSGIFKGKNPKAEEPPPP